MGFCVCSMFCCVLLCVLSSFAIILTGQRERELVALLCSSSCSIVMVIVLLLFPMVPWAGMQCVIVIFPDHTHLIFFEFQRRLFF